MFEPPTYFASQNWGDFPTELKKGFPPTFTHPPANVHLFLVILETFFDRMSKVPKTLKLFALFRLLIVGLVWGCRGGVGGVWYGQGKKISSILVEAC